MPNNNLRFPCESLKDYDLAVPHYLPSTDFSPAPAIFTES